MKIAVIGGAGAMGSIFGGLLAHNGNNVTLVDVAAEPVEAINAHGLKIEDRHGEAIVVRVRATTDPHSVGQVDLALVFVKCYDTESAIQNAAPLIGPATIVLSLQNGWGNAPRITSILGEERVLVGVTYHSGTLIGPGHVLHAGKGSTYVGELSGQISERLHRVGKTLTDAGLDTTPSDSVLNVIWSKLALNACTLPTSALLRFYSGELIEHNGTLALMRALLREVVAVAQAQGFTVDENERWDAITKVLQGARTGKSSMLQDVENRRRTEIDVINGAIVAAGQQLNILTPYNHSMVCLLKALDETF